MTSKVSQQCRQSRKVSLRGFTLTELLVALIVIAVFGAVAAPAYVKAIKRSRASDALKVLSLASARQEAYMLSNEEYANTFTKLGAPVKGLSGGTTAKVGYFEYEMKDGCIIASRAEDKYQIYRNYETNETGCIGEGCDNLQNLIPKRGSAGCELVGMGEGEGNEASNQCTINPNLPGCKETGRVECGSNKIYDAAKKECVCANSCTFGIQNENCTCACPEEACPVGQTRDNRCECKCPAERPIWRNNKCEALGECMYGDETEEGCSGGQIKTCDLNGEWTNNCECPQGQVLHNGICVQQICVSSEKRTCGTCGTQMCNANGTGWDTCQEISKPEDKTEDCGSECGKKTTTYTCTKTDTTAQWTANEGSCSSCEPISLPACIAGDYQIVDGSCKECNDSGEWTAVAARHCLLSPSDEIDNGDESTVNPVQSNMCCPATYIIAKEGPNSFCPAGTSEIANNVCAVQGGFDFAYQWCRRNIDPESIGMNSMVACTTLSSACSQDYYPLEYNSGGTVLCGRLQLYQCPSGHSFDNGGNCKAGSSGKIYKLTGLSPAIN
jgi:type IV pilus assembly protein PilE